MGRKNALSGLSRFIHAMDQPETSVFTSSDAIVTPSNGSTPTSLPKGTTRKAYELQNTSSAPPAKKQKVGHLNPGISHKYDASGLVPYYTNASQVPEKLKKYFSQRERYFSLYAEGCLLDEEGWYSVTPERVADQIAERCRCDTVLDAFCGVGGNTIAFAKTCERVIALDTSPVRLALARHNATIYGVADRIDFILGDYISFARSLLSLPPSKQRRIDVVFLSPPWGGPAYLEGSPKKSSATSKADAEADAHPVFSLSSIQPIHGAELFKLSRRITPNIAYFLPRNTDLNEISGLMSDSQSSGSASQATSSEMVEVEEEWMGSKLKALTCYFGGLAAGQEELFDS